MTLLYYFVPLQYRMTFLCSGKVLKQDSLITQDNTPSMPLRDAHLGGLLFL